MRNLEAMTLDDLVIRATSGDHDAFAGLVDRTRVLVCSIAMAILRDVDVSQEVAQDVYLAVWRDLRRLRSAASFLPWLRQMTRNRAHHVLRSRVRRRRVFADQDIETLVETSAAATGAGVGPLEDERLQRLADAIDALPEESREVVSLYYREGQSVQQVATLLDLRPDAVKQRLLRARTKLRAAVLDDLGDTLSATAPGAAFTAGVMALTLAAPGTAAAAGVLATSTSKAVALGWSGLLLSLMYALPGFLGGYAGLEFGHRRMLRAAADDTERRELIRVRGAALTTMILFCVAVPLGYRALRTPLVPIAAYVALIAAFADLFLRRVPRIIAPRLAAERQADPSAALRQRKDRRMRTLGFALGAIGGAVGVVAGLLATRGL